MKFEGVKPLSQKLNDYYSSLIEIFLAPVQAEVMLAVWALGKCLISEISIFRFPVNPFWNK